MDGSADENDAQNERGLRLKADRFLGRFSFRDWRCGLYARFRKKCRASCQAFSLCSRLPRMRMQTQIGPNSRCLSPSSVLTCTCISVLVGRSTLCTYVSTASKWETRIAGIVPRRPLLQKSCFRCLKMHILSTRPHFNEMEKAVMRAPPWRLFDSPQFANSRTPGRALNDILQIRHPSFFQGLGRPHSRIAFTQRFC